MNASAVRSVTVEDAAIQMAYARLVIVVPGFAGIENELFYQEKTSMLFGDAKASLGKLVTEMKNA